MSLALLLYTLKARKRDIKESKTYKTASNNFFEEKIKSTHLKLDYGVSEYKGHFRSFSSTKLNKGMHILWSAKVKQGVWEFYWIQ